VAPLRGIGEGAMASLAEVSLVAGLGPAVPDDLSALAVGAGDEAFSNNHASSLPEQHRKNHDRLRDRDPFRGSRHRF
jgi:hypothetical protein